MKSIHLLYIIEVVLIDIVLGTIYHVDPDNSLTTGSGKTWSKAFVSFELALVTAIKDDQIWLKGGYIYTPSTSNRSNCFVTKQNAKIYGGFIGNETIIEERPTLNANKYESIISGDINIKNINNDNCYHVLTYIKQLHLDRITIANGYAVTNQNSKIDNYGGALITFDTTKKSIITLNNVTFINNTGINGGALWFQSSPTLAVNVIITNCLFQNNMAINGEYEGGYGGAIYNMLFANITIINTDFIENNADFRGGGIYQDYGGYITCNQCTFTSNSAGFGGAIFAEDRNCQCDGTFPLIQSSLFDSNTADIYGGAICWFNGVIGTLNNNEFDSNTAGLKGGAIAIINSEIIGYISTGNTSNNIFNGNTAGTTNTNKIYNESSFAYNGIDSNIQNSIFIDVISYIDTIYTQWNDLSSTITDLYLFSAFNDLCFVNTDNSNSIKDGTSWTNAFNHIQECINKLSLNGGEIWVKRGIYNPTEVPLWKQNIGKNGQQHYSFNMAENVRMYGGFDGTETLRAERNFRSNPTYLSCNLGSNTYCNQIVQGADGALIDGFIFIEAQYDYGTRRRLANSVSVEEVLSSTNTNSGSGLFSNSTTISIVNSVFYALFSSGKGAAVYCIGQQGSDETNIKSPTFVNVAFIKNIGNQRGGAIAADVSCNFICKYCIFEGNSCAGKGGAIYLDFDSDATISQSIFTDNYAHESGGCIAADGKSLTTFTNTEFTNNYANWEGGCLYSGSGVAINIEAGFVFYETNTFTNNYLVNTGFGQNDIYGWPFTKFEFINDNNTDPQQQQTPSPIDVSYNISTPNILIFFIDDLSYIADWTSFAPSKFGTSGYVNISLQHIGGFMNESVVFPRTYAGGPKCSPSRFSILTGRYPHKGQYAIDYVLGKSRSDLANGIYVVVPTSKLYKGDGIYNIPYSLKHRYSNPYYTGMIGKWHLMTDTDNGYGIGCDSLRFAPNATLYDECTSIVQEQGFDFVDAWYHSNIDLSSPYSHDPEWMVDVATKFMDDASVRNQPFFLYFSLTLTHGPEGYDAFFKYNSSITPKGVLSGNNIPKNTGMDNRTYIWNKAMNSVSGNAKKKETAALNIWMDECFGALVAYLKNKGIYDDTFVVVMNDHGMGAKGTLFERGSRVIQSVRYPPLFGTDSHVFENFITSNVDLAAVIFEMTATGLDNDYVLDGKSWVMDTINAINGDTSDPECCEYRYCDIYQSHSIVTEQYKYIFRATNNTETDGNPVANYKDGYDKQQLYDLTSDPAEQNNLINDESLSSIIRIMQIRMIQYIENDMCGPLNITCYLPELAFTTFSPTNIPTTTSDISSTNTPTTTPDISSSGTTIKSVDEAGSSTDSGGLSGGAIAGIVITVLLIIIIIILSIWCWYRNLCRSELLKQRLQLFKRTSISNSRKTSYYENKKDISHGNMVTLSPRASKKIGFIAHTDDPSNTGFPNIEFGSNDTSNTKDKKSETNTTTNGGGLPKVNNNNNNNNDDDPELDI